MTLVGRDHVTFVIHYSLVSALLIDTHFALAYSPNMRHNMICVTFWKRFPRIDPMQDTFLFFRFDALHVPLFLFGKRGDPLYHLTSYLACRIFDHSDEASLHWKMANDPYNTKSLYYSSVNRAKAANNANGREKKTQKKRADKDGEEGARKINTSRKSPGGPGGGAGGKRWAGQNIKFEKNGTMC